MASLPDTIAAWVLESWSASLAQVLESLTGVRPETSFRLMEKTASPAEVILPPDALWWEQPFSLEGQPSVWVGVPAAAWRDLGSRLMRASGRDSAADAGLRSAFLEVLGQSLGKLATSLGSRLGQPVRAAGGREILEPPQTGVGAAIELTLEGTLLPALRVILAEGLLQAVEGAFAEQPLVVAAPAGAPAQPSQTPRTLDLLMEVELPVAVSFGRAELPLKDVLKLTTGSIVELNRTVDEPVELIVNNCVIARGEVVVVEGNYGVRIKQIISPQERLRTLK